MKRLLNASDYEGAANEFKNWRVAGGVVSPGLVKRRAQETDIFKNNIYDSTHHKFIIFNFILLFRGKNAIYL